MSSICHSSDEGLGQFDLLDLCTSVICQVVVLIAGLTSWLKVVSLGDTAEVSLWFQQKMQPKEHRLGWALSLSRFLRAVTFEARAAAWTTCPRPVPGCRIAEGFHRRSLKSYILGCTHQIFDLRWK